MGDSVRADYPKPLRYVRVRLARLHQGVGWAGIAGIALLAVAGIVMALAWSAQQAFVQASAARSVVALAPTPSMPRTDALPPATPDLPSASEIPLLLTQMKQAAISNSLDWRAAEYRVTAAISTQPASLEVRCNLKGPYPKLRGMLVQLMSAIPSFTIREFSASRPNADVADIEAKLVLAVFLQDSAIESEGLASKAVTKTATKGAR